MQQQSLARRAKSTLIGDRAFYRTVLIIVIPIIIQNAITNFVSLLDNIMVGRTGTDPMTGVSIVNQLMFVFNLCVFGGVSGAGIFSTQYHGAGNPEGVRHCFRFKIYLCAALVTLAIVLFLTAGTPLITLYLNETENPARVAATLGYGQKYLAIMLWGLAPFAVAQSYASTLRETGETALPMFAGIAAVLVNLTLNYVLIYGKFGAPAMGVEGAAIATVISRYAELAIIAAVTHSHPKKYPFARGAYRSGYVPMALVKRICVKGTPLLLNESFWSLGLAMVTRCYSMRGLDIISALNISSTVSNLFNVVFISMGNATAILIGQTLGAGDIVRAKKYSWQLIAFSLACCLVMGGLLCAASPFIPLIYKTEDNIRHLATQLLLISALYMPIGSFVNTTYFILRSGGKTMITFLFDCVYTWVVNLPAAYLLVTQTDLPIVAVYLLVQMTDLIKCVLGFILVRRGVWIHNIVSGTQA